MKKKSRYHKRLIAFVLTAAMLLSSVPAYAQTEYTEPDAVELEDVVETETGIEVGEALEAETEAETEAGKVIEAETETETDTKTGSNTEAESDIKTESDIETEVEIEIEAAEEVESEIESETEAAEDEVELMAHTAVVDNLLTSAKWVADYIRTHGFRYGATGKNLAIDHSDGVVTCDSFVMWALYRAGYTEMPTEFGLGLWSIPTWCETMGFKKITNINDVRAGDIMFQYNSLSGWGDPSHVYILGDFVSSRPASDSNPGHDNWYRYDGGKDEYISGMQPINTWLCGFTFLFAYRPTAEHLDLNTSIGYLAELEESSVTNLKATAACEGVKLSWTGVSVEPLTGYIIYGSNSNQTYHYIGTTTKTSFTDKNASVTKLNSYKVFPYFKDSSGEHHLGECLNMVSAYKLLTTTEIATKSVADLAVTKVTSGLTVSWKKLAGVSGYRVYRKIGSGTKTYIGTSTTTKFLDKKASYSEKNTYWVYPYVRSGDKNYLGVCKTPVYEKANVTVNNISTVAVSGLTSAKASTGIKLTWTALTGVTGYSIYRYSGNGDVRFVAQVTKRTYLDTGASPLVSNTYIVAPYILKSGKTYEGKAVTIKAGKSILNVTTMLAVHLEGFRGEITDKGLQLKWSPCEGVTGYAIYKVNAGKRTFIRVTSNTSWTDTTVKRNTTVSYEVYPYFKDASGKKIMGSPAGYTSVSQTYY